MLLGSGVRASAALSGAERNPALAEGQPALEKQIAAVDTARARSASKKESSKKRKATASGGGDTRGNGAGGSATRGARTVGSRVTTRMAVSGTGDEANPVVYYTSTRPGKIDMDLASAAALEALPRIGPVMARRIVADRDSLGPFGSLEELQRVKGIGPALASVISPYVTFSQRPRQSRVKEPARRPASSRARRAESHP
jgi:DNA uptake protein ComE-like DNA-binding protein